MEAVLFAFVAALDKADSSGEIFLAVYPHFDNAGVWDSCSIGKMS
mgnify:CR=1 FL=1